MIGADSMTRTRQTPEESELVQRLLKDFEGMASYRGSWERQWEQLAERLVPGHVHTFNARGNVRIGGETNTFELLDSTGVIALGRAVAIVDSLLTPQGTTWCKIVPSDKALRSHRTTMLWYEELTDIVFGYLYSQYSGFIGQNQLTHQSLVAYGTGVTFADLLLDRSGIRFRHIPLGEAHLSHNSQGIVDVMFRRFQLDARQFMQVKEWRDRIPDSVRMAAEKDWTKKFWVVHAVLPRQDYDPSRIDAKGKKFASYYVTEEQQTMLSEGGYNSFPYAVSRYSLSPNEVYGRSAAMDALPSMKTLNEEKRIVLVQGQRIVDPVMMSFDDQLAANFSLEPGSMNPGGMNAEGRSLIGVLPTGNPAVGKDLMAMEQAIINAAFMNDIMQILVDSPTMTAAEVWERTREKAVLLAPTIGRQQDDYLGPLVVRVVDLLGQIGAIPPVPRMVQQAARSRGIQYDLRFESPLTRARESEKVAGAQRAIEGLSALSNATGDPSVFDNLDKDKIGRQGSVISGMPEDWLLPEQQVADMRQQRAQQAQDEAATRAAPGAAALGKVALMARQGGGPRVPSVGGAAGAPGPAAG